MPELPDVTVYVECLAARCNGRPLERVRITGPSLLRSVVPPISEAEGRVVENVRRLGKRIVFALEDELFLVFHLMIAGRFNWRARGTKPSRKLGLAALSRRARGEKARLVSGTGWRLVPKKTFGLPFSPANCPGMRYTAMLRTGVCIS
jgi:formamidopyrimidine-DNA glycosylase